jgi:2-iminoacetate synthase ThiH
LLLRHEAIAFLEHSSQGNTLVAGSHIRLCDCRSDCVWCRFMVTTEPKTYVITNGEIRAVVTAKTLIAVDDVMNWLKKDRHLLREDGFRGT